MQKLLGRVKLPPKKQLLLALYFLVVLVIGGAVGILGYKYITSCKVKYLYINSSLGCGTNSSFDKSNPIVLKDNLSTYIDSEKSKGNVSEVSVYFRDLNNGPTLGINEDDLFISASLLKLPIALTLYKLAEDQNPGILEQKLEFNLAPGVQMDLIQYFKPTKTVTQGSTYTVSELIFNSLVYSDNLSNDVLKSYLTKIGNGQDLILRTLKDLGLTEPTSITTSDISTRSYASIFRILYNASYLSNEDSEKVLSILSQSEFDQGLAAGIPKEVRLANKFGERDLPDQKQLHDCGIVYYPGNPYLICVMTRGENYDTLTKVIKDISKIVYDEMSSRDKSR
jgi:beta-lactamase class A